MRRALAAVAAALAACATLDPPPLVVPGALDEDEARLWRVAGEAEETLARTRTFHADAPLEAYLLEVGRGLQPPEVLSAIPFRVRVVLDARPGAFCLPNGAIYVHSGLLARLEGEGELAAVLGHEMSHAVRRHLLRTERKRTEWGIGGSGLVHLASVSGYARDLEREADRDGLERMTAAGYDPADAVRMLERLRDFAAAQPRQERDPRADPRYARHPHIEERIETVRQLGRGGPPAAARRDPDAYLRRTASVLLDNGRLEQAAGRYRAAWDQVQRFLKLEPAHAPAHVLLGEIARRDGTAGAQDAAVSSYRRAIELDPRSAEAWRGLGLVLDRQGDRAGAREAFARYLALAPDAPDRALYRAALEEAP